MVAAVKPLIIEQHATFKKRLTWMDAKRAPLDLTGYLASMSIRDVVGALLVHRLTTENGGITLGGVEGTIDLHIPASETGNFQYRTATYALRLTDRAGTVIQILQGPAVLSRGAAP